MRQRAEWLLRNALGRHDARFREGQWECIEALLRKERLLVVQRTGWGKSMVYFLATRLLRERGAGATLLISPLLSLMRNQIHAADRLGLRALSINSTNRDAWPEIEDRLARNEVDLLLISPERLANEEFRNRVLSVIAPRTGLFVVDEAHCISDWGHDFRPDYRRIVRILEALPRNLPVLATTATANDRVVEDVRRQLGDMDVVRGPLMRHGLKLQTIRMPNAAARLAWLACALPQLPGSGIIYTLTVRDADRVARWLKGKGIPVEAYHAKSANREELEEQLLENRIKALVATVALGMGFDKPDLGFVVHFQRPGSVVHYYQQVGRAGRAVPEAFGILLAGEEDDEISDYFIRTAFPPVGDVNAILKALRASDNMTIHDLQQKLNLSWGAIDKVLQLLSVESPSPVHRMGTRWTATPVSYAFDEEKVVRLGALRKAEQREMADYMEDRECSMKFLARSLSDPASEECGICSVCRGEPLLPTTSPPELVREATRFLKRCYVPLRPRLRWPQGDPFPTWGWKGRIEESLVAEEGRALCLWGDAGWGEQVRKEKYRDGRFSDALVEACVEMVREWRPAPAPDWVTSVPSLARPRLVAGFAQRLARKLGISFIPLIEKASGNAPQKEMQNSFQQARNLDGVFHLSASPPPGPAFLVDDLVDSRWTMTVLAALLRQGGCGAVFPLALALNTFSAD